MTTLIVCSTMPEAQRYYKDAMARDEAVIACSSMAQDDADAMYARWRWLPDIYHPEFLAHLKKLIADHDIARIFCPHDLMYQTLQGYIAAGDLTVKLLGVMPSLQRMETMRSLYGQAADGLAFITQITPAHALPGFRVAAMLKQAEHTFGESSVSKQLAAIALFPELPAGDIVEVGSLWGKMAVLFAMLARDCRKGALLCVDPWQREYAMQKDSPAIEHMPGINDWDLLFRGFTVHLAAVAEPGKCNYLRMPSAAAAACYSNEKTVSSPEFGVTHYAGTIALIHIDGNHDYAHVSEDYRRWRPYVAPGGWMIVDDYVWHHGDGPKRLGDEMLAAEAGAISRSFVAGKALFLQFT